MSNPPRLLVTYIAFVLSLGMFAEITQAKAFSFPLPPRLSANGYATDYTVGEADLMLPMMGDCQHNFYLDPTVAYGTDSQGYADLGLGYRWIRNDTAIWGIYLFGGYTRIENNARLWVANPGIEALGSRWDARLNAYFPIGDRNKMLRDVQRFYFTGHSSVTDLIRFSQYAGNGADVKVGYQLFPHASLKGYVGSYFFNPSQTSNVWGGTASLEYWLVSTLKIFASYTYDNLRHSTGALGLGVELGGTHTKRINPTLEERITDPVERYFAELGRGSAIPSRLKTQLIPGSRISVLSNLAFFSQSGGPNNGGVGLTLANCTFENPCGPTDLTNVGVSTLNTLLPNTQMYFNGGSYKALDVLSGTNPVTLQSGQSISSRTADYSQLATGVERSTFDGRLLLTGNNTITNAIVIPPAGSSIPGSAAGIAMLANASNIVITGSQIGSSTDSNSQPLTGFGSFGAGPTYNNKATLDNVTIFAQNTGINFGGPFLTIRNSTVNSGGAAATSTGIRSTEINSTIDIQQSQINVNSIISTTVRGIQASFINTQVTVSDVMIYLNASAAGAEVDALLVGDGTTGLTVNKGVIRSNNSAGAAYVVGGTNITLGHVNINQSLLDVNGVTALIKKAVSNAVLSINTSTCTANGLPVVC